MRRKKNLVTLALLNRGQLLDSLGNDAQALPELGFGNNQWRRKADNIAVSGLGLNQTG